MKYLPHVLIVLSAYTPNTATAQSECTSAYDHSFSLDFARGMSSERWAGNDRIDVYGVCGHYTVSPQQNRTNETFSPEAGCKIGFITGDSDGGQGIYDCDLSDVYACLTFGAKLTANKNFSVHASAFAGCDVMRTKTGCDDTAVGLLFGVDFSTQLNLAPKHSITIGISAGHSTADTRTDTGADDDFECPTTFVIFHVGYKFTL